MVIELRLPELAESVTSAKLGSWLKKEGESVLAGEPLVEVETDKTSVEIEAPASGVLQTIQVPAGTDGLEAGALLALIAEEGASPTANGDAPAIQSGTAAAPVSARDRTETVPVGEVSIPTAIPQPMVPAETPHAAASADMAVAATPLARRMATAAGLDWTRIRGTARGGRVGKADVERVIREQRVTEPGRSRGVDRSVARPPMPTTALDSAAFEERPLSAIRKVTAMRLLEAKQTIPHFYLRVDCAADAVLDLRARINARQSDVKITLTDILVRAVALALRKVPQANSTWADGAIRVYKTVDVSVAVNTPAGLITPVVREADRKGLAMISRELKALTECARAGRLKPEEYSGGTVTISNLGMYGVDSLYAIVNPPQSCILGVGAVVERAVVREGTVTVGRVLACTLSADHRAIDGATGAELLAEFRRLIEEPGLLAL